jgi:hypothetical protein
MFKNPWFLTAIAWFVVSYAVMAFGSPAMESILRNISPWLFGAWIWTGVNRWMKST